MSALKKPLEETVKKILENASTTGVVSKEQLSLILMYYKESNADKSIFGDLLEKGEKILEFIEKIFN